MVISDSFPLPGAKPVKKKHYLCEMEVMHLFPQDSLLFATRLTGIYVNGALFIG